MSYRAVKYEDEEMNNESRIVRIETVIEHLTYILDKMDKRADITDKKIDDLRIDMKQDFVSVYKKVDSNFKWLVSIIISLFLLNLFVPVAASFISKLTAL